MTLSRRRFAGLAGTMLLGGCLDTASPGRKEQPEESPKDSPESSATGTERCASGLTVSAGAFAPVDDLPAKLDERERSVVADAVEQGETTVTTYGQAPVRADILVRQDGAFYRTAYSITSTEQVPAYEFNAMWEKGQEAPEDATVVAFEDLPTVDQEVLETTLLGSEGDGLPQRGLSVTAYPAPYPEGAEQSALIGNQSWVRWRDRTISVVVAGEQTGTQERRSYRYTVEQVAADEAAFRAFVDDHYLVALEDLPDSQRSIVRSAIESSYQECRPPSDDLAGLRERLSDEPSLPHPYQESWYVTVEGDRYKLAIRRWQH